MSDPNTSLANTIVPGDDDTVALARFNAGSKASQLVPAPTTLKAAEDINNGWLEDAQKSYLDEFRRTIETYTDKCPNMRGTIVPIMHEVGGELSGEGFIGVGLASRYEVFFEDPICQTDSQASNTLGIYKLRVNQRLENDRSAQRESTTHEEPNPYCDAVEESLDDPRGRDVLAEETAAGTDHVEEEGSDGTGQPQTSTDSGLFEGIGAEYQAALDRARRIESDRGPPASQGDGHSSNW